MDPDDREPEIGMAPAENAGVDDGRALLRLAWEWTRSILVAVLLFVLVRSMGVEAFKIPTGSMESTLLVGDFLLVNKAAYGARIPGTNLHLPALSEPHRGDVIVFKPPQHPDKNYVKRVVGIPGDTLEMQDKVLIVNGVAVDEPYVRHIDVVGDATHPDMEWQENHLIASEGGHHRPSRDQWGPLVVPEDQFFVLGDNRDNSEDSRYWGFVDRDRLRGRPWIVYFSSDPREREDASWFERVRWGRLGHRIR